MFRNGCSFLVLIAALLLPLDGQVRGQFRGGSEEKEPDSHHLTKYILQRLLGSSAAEKADLAEAEARIFSNKKRGGGKSPSVVTSAVNGDASVVYPEYLRTERSGTPIRRYLDEAKEHIDVIDFRRRSDREDDFRRSRLDSGDDDLQFSDSDRSARSGGTGRGSRGSRGEASEQVPVKLEFPGNDFQRLARESGPGCTNCVNGGGSSPNRWTMPLQRLGDKQYYLGIFFKANWYKAEQYCRFHGMHLASINSADEQRDLQEHIQAYGMGHEHFWTSGTDQGEEGKFFWMATGRPVTYSNWNAGEPNNFEYEDGEQEHCLEMWDRDGKGLGWNDTPCSFETFFICEA